MESDPGREGCPIALQTSDAWEAAVAGEAQMTWLTYREKVLSGSCLRGLDRAQPYLQSPYLQSHLGSGVCSCARTGLPWHHQPPSERKCQLTCWSDSPVSKILVTQAGEPAFDPPNPYRIEKRGVGLERGWLSG